MQLNFSYKELDFITLNDSKVDLNWSRIWANRGHTLGEGLISSDKKTFYLNVPKNSSSTIKSGLTEIGWEFASVYDYPDADIIVVWRDPIERWASGIFEYLLMYNVNAIDSICEPFNYDLWPLIGEKLGMSIIFDRMTFDDHTDRQCVFLHNINLDRCTWIKINDGFNYNFSTLLTKMGYENTFLTAESKNVSQGEFGTTGYKKERFKEFINYVIDNDQFKKYNLHKWFWCDFELMYKIKFYEAR
jgi:hypothetical protein